MSFTSKIKNELCASKKKTKFVMGELFAIENYILQKGKVANFTKKYLDLLKHNYNFEKAISLSDIKKSSNSKRGFLSGVFICCGIMNDPAKSYNLEFVNDKLVGAEILQKILDSLHVNSKITERKNNFVNYIREAEMISKFLSLVGANISLMEFENTRILKELRNNVNRGVNFEAANLNKTIIASVDKSNDIEYVISNVGINYLPDNLREAALCRIKYKQANLKELGQKFSPSISKSCMYYKLKKISEIAEELRNRKGDKK